MQQHRDWKIIFALFALLTALVMIGNSYMLYRLNRGTLFSAPPEVSDMQILNQKKIVRDVNNMFDELATDYATFQAIVPTEIDPSL